MNTDMSKTKVICILPVKNESWILKNFVECALTWADFIIIGDHNSTDESINIARHYDRVKVVPLLNPSFDAGARRKILLDEARKIPGKRLTFVIDADEMISANWSDSPEWALMLNAQPGTSFQFDSPYLFPGLEKAYFIGLECAFVDDNSEYSGSVINETRLPATTCPKIHLQDIKVLHYQHIDPQRLLSRHRFYKCVDVIEKGTRPWAACIEWQDTEVKSYGLPTVSVDQAWLSDLWRSGQRESMYFAGYSEEWPERAIPMDLSRVSKEDIRAYFSYLAPTRKLTIDELDSISRATRGIPLAFGGTAFVMRPSLARRIPRHALGNQLEDSLDAIESLLAAPPPTPSPPAREPSLREAHHAFLARRPHIEAQLLAQIPDSVVPAAQLHNGLDNLSQAILDGLVLGDLDLVAPELPCVEGLMVNARVPTERLATFLSAYARAVADHLGPQGKPVVEWLDRLTGDQPTGTRGG